MPKGISIHVGLNDVDPTNFTGLATSLKGCEFDARDMCDIAQSQGFTPLLLLGAEAKCERVIKAIEDAAMALETGDILLFTFSGHGRPRHDPIIGDEPDSQDEMMVLFDHYLLDDQLFVLWAKFRAGVRILFIPDCCHSGTLMHVPVDAPEAAVAGEPANPAVAGDDGFFPENDPMLDEKGQSRLVRELPTEVRNEHGREFQDFYTSIINSLPNKAASKAAVIASLLQISACQDNEKALDGPRNGVFTQMLREVWAGGAFQGNYQQFFNQIYTKTIPYRQHPNFAKLGVTYPDFEGGRPFKV